MVYNCQKRKEAQNIKQKEINYISYYVTIAISNIDWNENINEILFTRKRELQNIINKQYNSFCKNNNTHIKNCIENGLED